MISHALNEIDYVPVHRGASLPPVFCWTKMGAESGQGLNAILQRKELERQSGGGLFSWGIGNSIGPALDHARKAKGWPSLSALFTAMRSPPKSIDVAPDVLFLWLGYDQDDGSVAKLPEHMLVTSRAHGPSGTKKRSHYALMCRRSRPIEPAGESPSLDGSCVRNLVSDGRVGFSQVTSVVRYDPELAVPNSAAYPVLFDAELAGQWFVRLADPVAIEGPLLGLYEQACASRSPAEWLRAVRALKATATDTVSGSRPTQQTLFSAPLG